MPFVAHLWDGEVDEATSRRGTVYARDQWSVHERVTLNLGVRLDVNRASVPVNGTIFSTNPVSPRAGVAWAVTADRATVVRAHYGRYHDSILTQKISDLDVSDQSPFRIALVLPDGQLFEVVRVLDAANTTVDDGIRQSYVDQYVIGVEREVGPNFSAQVQLTAASQSHLRGEYTAGPGRFDLLRGSEARRRSFTDCWVLRPAFG